MIAAPAISGWFARLHRIGADTAVLAGVSAPADLVQAPAALVAGFDPDPRQRLSQAVARVDGVVIPPGEPTSDTPRPRRAPGMGSRPAAVTAGMSQVIAERFAASDRGIVATTNEPAPGERIRDDRPMPTRADRVGKTEAHQAETFPPATARSWSPVPVAAVPSALRWSMADDAGVTRDDLLAMIRQAELATGVAEATSMPGGARSPAIAPAEPRRQEQVSPDLVHPAPVNAAAARLAGGRAMAPDDQGRREPTSSSADERAASPFSGGSQLSKILNLWQANRTPQDPSVEPHVPTPPARSVSPSTTQVETINASAAQRGMGAALPAGQSWSHLVEGDPLSEPVRGADAADDRQRFSDLLERILVQAVERQGLTVEEP